MMMTMVVVVVIVTRCITTQCLKSAADLTLSESVVVQQGSNDSIAVPSHSYQYYPYTSDREGSTRHMSRAQPHHNM